MNKSPNESRIVICGTARNVERKIDAVVSNVTRSFSSFQEVQILICESFSSDKTVEKLTKIRERLSNFDFIHDQKIEKNETRRTVRISSSRSELQSEIRQQYNDFDYVAMLDLDGVNRDLSKNAVDSIWKFDNWDCAFANQPFRYYDVWALRAENWCEQDCWEEFEALTAYMPVKAAMRIAVTSKMKSISKKSPPVLVESAFGGLGIYRMDAFLEGQYVGHDEAGKEICEHVHFHKTLSKIGYKLYIMPSLVNLKQHSQRINVVKELILRLIRRIK